MAGSRSLSRRAFALAVVLTMALTAAAPAAVSAQTVDACSLLTTQDLASLGSFQAGDGSRGFDCEWTGTAASGTSIQVDLVPDVLPLGTSFDAIKTQSPGGQLTSLAGHDAYELTKAGESSVVVNLESTVPAIDVTTTDTSVDTQQAAVDLMGRALSRLSGVATATPTPSSTPSPTATPAGSTPAGFDPELATRFPAVIDGQPVSDIQTFSLFAALTSGKDQSVMDRVTTLFGYLGWDPASVSYGDAFVPNLSSLVYAIRTPGADARTTVARWHAIEGASAWPDLAAAPIQKAAELGGRAVTIVGDPPKRVLYPAGDTVFFVNEAADTTDEQLTSVIAGLPAQDLPEPAPVPAGQPVVWPTTIDGSPVTTINGTLQDYLQQSQATPNQMLKVTQALATLGLDLASTQYTQAAATVDGQLVLFSAIQTPGHDASPVATSYPLLAEALNKVVGQPQMIPVSLGGKLVQAAVPTGGTPSNAYAYVYSSGDTAFVVEGTVPPSPTVATVPQADAIFGALP